MKCFEFEKCDSGSPRWGPSWPAWPWNEGDESGRAPMSVHWQIEKDGLETGGENAQRGRK